MLTNEQKEERRGYLGGSDAGAVAGLNDNRSPLAVWLDKTGRGDDFAGNPATFWGNVLEEPVARVYQDTTGHKIRRRGMIVSKDYPFMCANLDRVIVGDSRGPGVLEVKTAGAYMREQWGPDGSDQVPDSYLAQVAHYLAVTGYTWARLAVLIGGQDFRVYDIPRDEELIQYLIDVERRFWNDHVLTDIPPDPASSADIAKRWPRDNGTEVVANQKITSALADLRHVRLQISELETNKQQIEDEIKSAIGDASTLVDAFGTPLATWKTQTSKRIDIKALRLMHPDIAEKYSTETESRVFRLKKEKTND